MADVLVPATTLAAIAAVTCFQSLPIDSGQLLALHRLVACHALHRCISRLRYLNRQRGRVVGLNMQVPFLAAHLHRPRVAKPLQAYTV